ncbi:PREDICTED: G-type lectin S-receptor-like serine/threonine-protein kinase SRK [Camelina sativa]|uniref:G-type lectin S-receptor-like serine/threonine-protein kinase SRK n=1 Tax=Camelina sativa TaxID=90675 RepID=A0ABM0WTS2_CAMSA|nr:PREDICTED: G-type lectin S-receptor-like serine/threonine-protein kinase SRK [Camelina sativa]
MMKLFNNSQNLLVFSFLMSFFLVFLFTDGSFLLSEEPFTFSGNKTIASHGDVFELGIFKPDSSSPDEDRWYLGIWFKRISERTYVWVANRDKPLSKPTGTIRVRKSNLILSDESNTVVWSTNVTEESERSPIVAELLDDGNFVLRHTNNKSRDAFLWQSFDFPTDTLLPGMKLGWEHRTGRYSFLTSWKDFNDPSSGDFSYHIESARGNRGFPALFLWNGRNKMNRLSPWDGVASFGVPHNQPLAYLTFTLTANKEEVSFSFQTSDRKYTSRLTLTSVGSVQQLMWNETSSTWDMLWHSPTDACDIYKYCGPYSYCDISTCTCMKGFEPMDPQAWALGNRGDGCVREKPLSCSDDKFFRLINCKLPDTTNAFVDWQVGFNECEQRCVNDCNCTAFTTVEQSGSSGCVIWTRELLDVRNSDYVTDGHDLFVKYHENFSAEIIAENLELPIMSFETISRATDDFSVSNKLGSGGFGVVYKGILDGQEIAVKRLSDTSDQGIDEFKSELTLITKVQHVNLVRLFGYCINGEEKLLIYEYLENKSLDLHLFDETKSDKLNWPERIEIALGVARGLLYLHEYSATMIIHRDLKPSNILLDKDMRPKISDFGTARIFERGNSNVETTTIVGRSPKKH